MKRREKSLRIDGEGTDMIKFLLMFGLLLTLIGVVEVLVYKEIHKEEDE